MTSPASVLDNTAIAPYSREVVSDRAKASNNVRTVGKLTATTSVNMSASIVKDAAFAKMFGCPSQPIRVVPFPAYTLFASRDVLSIGAAFTVPVLVAPFIEYFVVDKSSALAVAQLSTPVLMQVICTPLHLTALNLVNMPPNTVSVSSRILAVSSVFPSALLARATRMLPAYGVGGLLNSKLMKEAKNVL